MTVFAMKITFSVPGWVPVPVLILFVHKYSCQFVSHDCHLSTPSAAFNADSENLQALEISRRLQHSQMWKDWKTMKTFWLLRICNYSNNTESTTTWRVATPPHPPTPGALFTFRLQNRWREASRKPLVSLRANIDIRIDWFSFIDSECCTFT